jgi:hypothetical protein
MSLVQAPQKKIPTRNYCSKISLMYPQITRDEKEYKAVRTHKNQK